MNNNANIQQPLLNPNTKKSMTTRSMRTDLYVPPPKFVPDKTVYKENFYYMDGKIWTVVKINFRQGCLTLRPSANKEKRLVLKFKNLIGAACSNAKEFIPPDSTDNQPKTFYGLTIYLYPRLQVGRIAKKPKRVLVEKDFYHADENMVKRFSEMLLNISKMPSFLVVNQEKTVWQLPEYSRRRLLVFVNPRAGSGKSPFYWRVAQPIFDRAGFSTTKIDTTHPKHAYEYLSKIPLSELKQYQGILTLSGDGLPHEVINALFSRPDSEEASKIPIGALPGGSGNALCYNVATQSNEAIALESSVFIIAKGQTKDVDLMMLETEKGDKVYSFLSLAWALVSDVDFGSEHLRCCGGNRFEIYTAWRWMFLRRYHARLSFTTSKEGLQEMPGFQEKIDHVPGWETFEDRNFSHFLIGKMPLVSEGVNMSPLAKFDDEFLDLTMLRGNAGKYELLKYLLNIDEQGGIIDMENERPFSNSSLEYKKIKAFRLEPLGNSQGVFSIDGERYQAQTIQGCVMPRALKLFVF